MCLRGWQEVFFFVNKKNSNQKVEVLKTTIETSQKTLGNLIRNRASKQLKQVRTPFHILPEEAEEEAEEAEGEAKSFVECMDTITLKSLQKLAKTIGVVAYGTKSDIVSRISCKCPKAMVDNMIQTLFNNCKAERMKARTGDGRLASASNVGSTSLVVQRTFVVEIDEEDDNTNTLVIDEKEQFEFGRARHREEMRQKTRQNIVKEKQEKEEKDNQGPLLLQ